LMRRRGAAALHPYGTQSPGAIRSQVALNQAQTKLVLE
jgi:hypothetical protein